MTENSLDCPKRKERKKKTSQRNFKNLLWISYENIEREISFLTHLGVAPVVWGCPGFWKYSLRSEFRFPTWWIPWSKWGTVTVLTALAPLEVWVAQSSSFSGLFVGMFLHYQKKFLLKCEISFSCADKRNITSIPNYLSSSQYKNLKITHTPSVHF